jgi:hypothetical protein
MTLYQIERNVPLVQISKPPRERKYPFRELNKGDSFFVPVHDTKTIPRVRAAAWACVKLTAASSRPAPWTAASECGASSDHASH